MAAPIDKGNEGGLSWALWARDGKYGKEYSLTLKNSWKDKDGKWQESDFIPEKMWSSAETVLQGLRLSKFQTKRAKKSQPENPPQQPPPTTQEVQEDSGVPF